MRWTCGLEMHKERAEITIALERKHMEEKRQTLCILLKCAVKSIRLTSCYIGMKRIFETNLIVKSLIEHKVTSSWEQNKIFRTWLTYVLKTLATKRTIPTVRQSSSHIVSSGHWDDQIDTCMIWYNPTQTICSKFVMVVWYLFSLLSERSANGFLTIFFFPIWSFYGD